MVASPFSFGGLRRNGGRCCGGDDGGGQEELLCDEDLLYFFGSFASAGRLLFFDIDDYEKTFGPLWRTR